MDLEELEHLFSLRPLLTLSTFKASNLNLMFFAFLSNQTVYKVTFISFFYKEYF